MPSPYRSAIAVAVAFLGVTSAPAAEPLSKAEVAKLTKPATALVDAKPIYGSAFCVHPAGLFVTNNHVVATLSESDTVTLVLGAGGDNQKAIKAKVIRRDKDRDLALLKCEGDHALPFVKLGSDEKLGELEDLVALGFPFGTELAKPGSYPAISVNAVAISSLRKDTKGALDRIQVDGALNPGNSGGPMMNLKGELVGVVVSGIRGAGITMAIPVGHVRRFVERPEILLAGPDVKPEQRTAAVDFKVTIASVLGGDEKYDVELLIDSEGAERRFPMKADGAAFSVKAAPFAAPVATVVIVDLKYAEGTVTLPVADLALTIGNKPIKLSDLKSVKFGASLQATLKDGTVTTALAGLDSIPATLGGEAFRFPTKSAVELSVRPPVDTARGRYKISVVTSRKGKELGREEFARYLVGMEPRGPEELLKGKFAKPPVAVKPTTYLKIVSTAGDFIGQGKTYNYGAEKIKMQGTHGGGVVATVGEIGDWRFTVGPAKGGQLKVGEYPGATRFPFHDKNPGLDFSGMGRGSNSLTGKFVVWEIEMDGEKVIRAAIDFVQYSEGKTETPLVGMFRFNSTLE